MNIKKLAYLLIILILSTFLIVSGVLFVMSRFYDNLLILDLISYVISNLTIILVFLFFAGFSIFMIVNAVIAHRIKKQENLFFLQKLHSIRSQKSTEDMIQAVIVEFSRIFNGAECFFYSFESSEKEFTLVYPENNDEFSVSVTDDTCRIILDNNPEDLFPLNESRELVECEISGKLVQVFTIIHQNLLSGILIVYGGEVSIRDSASIEEFTLTAVSFLTLALRPGLTSSSNPELESFKNIYPEIQLSSIIEKEIERADRFQNDLSLVSISMDPQMADKYSLTSDSPIYTELSNNISHAIRSFDYLFFMENQERFILILPQSNSQQAYELCERINEEMSKKSFYIPLIDKKDSICLFWGITSYPDDTTLKANLLENSELSLRSAIENSSRIVLYKSIYD